VAFGVYTSTAVAPQEPAWAAYERARPRYVLVFALARAAALVSETLSGRSARFFGAAADQQDG